MKCREARGYIAPYLDGAISRDVRRQMEQHLAICPACRQHLAVAEDVKLGGSSRPLAIPDGFWEKMDEALSTEVDRQPSAYRRSLTWLRQPVRVSRGSLILGFVLFLVALTWGFREQPASVVIHDVGGVEEQVAGVSGGGEPELERVAHRPVLQLY